jgi:3-hydroxyisobutyrate dehydrogenase-like beta-hydroxyacid dehydrogenase
MAAPRAFGFIGLGLMGFPMACNLARSLEASEKLYAFDLVSSTMDRLSELFPEKVIKASSAKDVAALSVRAFLRRKESFPARCG